MQNKASNSTDTSARNITGKKLGLINVDNQKISGQIDNIDHDAGQPVFQELINNFFRLQLSTSPKTAVS